MPRAKLAHLVDPALRVGERISTARPPAGSRRELLCASPSASTVLTRRCCAPLVQVALDPRRASSAVATILRGATRRARRRFGVRRRRSPTTP